jgi:adenylate kinase
MSFLSSSSSVFIDTTRSSSKTQNRYRHQHQRNKTKTQTSYASARDNQLAPETMTSKSQSSSRKQNEIIQISAKKVQAPPVVIASKSSPVIGALSQTQIAAGVFAACAIGITAKKAMQKKVKKIVIAGAPASGKGTQCELIVKKFGITHISAGDLLRAAVAQGTEDGLRAKEFMDRGDLVPDEVVVNMVKSRLNEPDCANGWLLDGYPRSASQAEALSSYGIEPDLFLLLDVPDEELLERVVGRRLDPVTGQIYHLKFFPPPDDAVAKRLTQRSDDTEEKAANRLKVHHANVNAVTSKYKVIMKTIDGNRQKTTVFKEIEGLIKSM